MSVRVGEGSLVPGFDAARDSGPLAALPAELLPRRDLCPSKVPAPAAVEPNWKADMGSFRGRIKGALLELGADAGSPGRLRTPDVERDGRLSLGPGEAEDSAGEAELRKSGNCILLLSKEANECDRPASVV